jgi:peptidyl-prolyl cis-trans isomerase A (cyclophilin A)
MPKAPPPSDEDAGASPPSTVVQNGGRDPLRGRFSMLDATAGMAKSGTIVAHIMTVAGSIDCRLYDDKAPNSVANFVGLARGLRPWKNASDEWVKQPVYDGTTFHRIIKGFMIQGGDPKGDGTGEPGYTIPDENWAGARHDRAGLLCMANRGPNTNGAQFFITDGAAPHLDGGYTIFGECSPVSRIHTIAATSVIGDKPDVPPSILRVTITR